MYANIDKSLIKTLKANLLIANKELAFQNKEKEKCADELIIANKELVFQNDEKEKRADELIIANKELAFQNDEKEKRADELIIANKELAFQNDEKEKRADELIIANKELAFQIEEKEKRADELIIANKELAFQIEEKEKYAEELMIANSEISIQKKLVELQKDYFNEKQERLKEVEYISFHDSLTGLYNRGFYEKVLREIDVEKNLPLSLIMGDINGLKLVNDSFGHKVGDNLLKKVATVINKCCRLEDLAIRLSGDEFIVLLPKTDITVVKEFITNINEHLKLQKINGLNIFVSFGYGIKTQQNQDMEVIFKNAENKMYKQKLYESQSVKSETINLISRTLFAKNVRELDHSNNVSKICVEIAVKMNMNTENKNLMRISGLMHDIGKIGISDSILNKTTKLNDQEFEEIKKHPEIGYRILSSVNEFSDIADFVLQHHERWDGSGYPQGLKGEEISIEARIIAVADSYDAMTTLRPYRETIGHQEAINEIKRCSGSQFDPAIVNVFLSMTSY